MEEIRLNKYLSGIGFCSRREADRLMEEGRVSVDGETAAPGRKVYGTERILIDEKEIAVSEKKVVLALNKPAGIICSTKDQGREHNNIVDFVGYPLRLFPIGRLDKPSTGIILLTNDGSLVNGLLKGARGHEKEYEVTVAEELKDEVLSAMARGGLPLEEHRVTRPCKVRRLSKRRFSCILTEGMNRQIRRMCEYFGLTVTKLNRVRFMFLTLNGLEEGEYRILTPREIARLKSEAGGIHS